jgi:hypothetical protein
MRELGAMTDTIYKESRFLPKERRVLRAEFRCFLQFLSVL